MDLLFGGVLFTNLAVHLYFLIKDSVGSVKKSVRAGTCLCMRCFKKSANKSMENGTQLKKAAPIHPVVSNLLDVIKEEEEEEDE